MLFLRRCPQISKMGARSMSKGLYVKHTSVSSLQPHKAPTVSMVQEVKQKKLTKTPGEKLYFGLKIVTRVFFLSLACTAAYFTYLQMKKFQEEAKTGRPLNYLLHKVVDILVKK